MTATDTKEGANGVDMKPMGDGAKVNSEKARLVEKSRKLSVETAVRLRLAILIISWISVIGLGILGLITLVISILENSSASFAFALDAWLDCISSSVVIWRFSSATQLYSAKREKIACIALGCLFIVSSLIIITKSSLALHDGSVPEKTNLVWYLSIVNAVACFFLLFAKMYLAKRLESVAVATDAINSGLGFVLAFSTLISDIVYQKNNSIWYMDPVIGIVCAFALMAYGIWVIIYETSIAKGDDLDDVFED